MHSFSRCLSRPCRDISHGMSSGRTTFLRLELRTGAVTASSKRFWYSFSLSVPLIQAFASSQAIVRFSSPFARVRCVFAASIAGMIVVLFVIPRHEIALGGRGRLRTFLDRVLEQ